MTCPVAVSPMIETTEPSVKNAASVALTSGPAWFW